MRRQHCSSLCSQSEGHEHVANMTNALGHDFVGFSARAAPQPSSPSLCKQSELQCYRRNLRPPHFASKVSYNAAPQKALQCWRPKARYNAAPQSASLPTSHTYFLTPFNKSSFCGRDSCYPRPRVALPSAASSATCGRESMTSQ